MTTMTPPESADAAGSPPAVHGAFHGAGRAFWRLMVRGAALLMLTFGLYRFWLTTDTRRFLWTNTEIAGERFEYAGTPLELLIGFLLAVMLLVPLYAGFFLLAVHLGLLDAFSSLAGFLLLAVLGQYAVYRARRYRLTRTVYRGVRFHQSGSAWRYALIAVMWWGLIALTFGLAYPFACARLERYKMRHTFFGDMAGDFDGRGFSLFWRGAWMWLVVFVPFIIGIVAALDSVDWEELATALAHEGDANITGWIEGASPALGSAFVYGIGSLAWLALAAGLLYPAFQAVKLRWWMNALRFGSVRIASHLRAGTLYRAYIRFLIYGLLFAFAIGIGATIALFVIGIAEEHMPTALASEILATVALLVGYVVIMLGYSTIHQATVRLAVWRASVDALTVTGADALAHVRASGHASSALGEGLADALHVGSV